MPLVLLFILLRLAKVFGLLVFDDQFVFALEILHNLGAAAAGEAGQVDCGVPGFINQNGDLFHGAILRSPGSEEQLDLLTVFGLDDFPAPEDVASLPRHSKSAVFLVSLVDAVQPFLIEADAPVILAENGTELPVRVPHESDVIRCAIEMSAADDDVGPFRALITVIAEQRRCLGVNFHRIAERFQRRDQRSFFGQGCLKRIVFGHKLSRVCEVIRS